MHDQPGEPRRQWNRLDFERATVDQERVVVDACDRCELIHDPARYARRNVLGFLAGEREVEARELESG